MQIMFHTATTSGSLNGFPRKENEWENSEKRGLNSRI